MALTTRYHDVPVLDEGDPEGYLFLQLDRLEKEKKSVPVTVAAQRAVWSKLIDWHQETLSYTVELRTTHSQSNPDEWRRLLSQWAVEKAPSAVLDSVRLVVGVPPKSGFASDKFAKTSLPTLKQKLDPSSDIRSLLRELTDNATDPRREISDQDWANAKEELRLRRDEGKADPQPATLMGVSTIATKLAAAYQKRLDTNRSLQGGENLAGPSQIPSGWGSAYQTQPGPSQQHLNTIGSYYAAARRVLNMPQGTIEEIEDEE